MWLRSLCPVLHINSDDVEAVVHGVSFALDYRMEFGEDVFIDLLGYRKYGHNEGDEPRFTQPQLYKAIGNHKNPKEIYAEKLINEGVIGEDYLTKIETECSLSLESDLEDSKKLIPLKLPLLWLTNGVTTKGKMSLKC